MPVNNDARLVLETAPRWRRSVFGNYTQPELPPTEALSATRADAARPETRVESCADLAWTRSGVHQFLARAFDYPTQTTWSWLSSDDVQQGLAVAVAALEPDGAGPLGAAQQALTAAWRADAFDRFHDAYVPAIGHAARGSCPINEIEYGDLKADPLFQPHRLADLAGFYHAFGLEVAADGDERLDHLSAELEFMAVLAAQEASLLNTAQAGHGVGSELRTGDVAALTRPSGTLSHRMGEGRGEGPGTLSHRMGEGRGEGPGTLSRRTGEGRGEGPSAPAAGVEANQDGGSSQNLGALAVCREAQRKFLREHLGRWTPAFARRLHRIVGDGPLGALAVFTLAFIQLECRRLGVTSGSEDLLLRPADAAASLCDGCGLSHALPGTATPA